MAQLKLGSHMCPYMYCWLYLQINMLSSRAVKKVTSDGMLYEPKIIQRSVPLTSLPSFV